MPVPETLIQIDLDPEQIGMNHPVAVGIVADAKAALERDSARHSAIPDAPTAGARSGTRHAPRVPRSRNG